MLGGTFEKNKVEGKIKAYNDKIVKENFWKDKKSAQQIVKEKTYFEEIFTSYNFVLNELKNLEELLDLAVKEKDNVVVDDCAKKITFLLKKIKKTEVECFLSGENDYLDTYLEIHAGAGGTESQDWVMKLE